jgi:glutamate-1-semialdehyde 2,1-aminomutase
VYVELERMTARLVTGLSKTFTTHGVPHVTAHAGSMFGYFFTDGPVTDLGTAKKADIAFFRNFFHGMLDRGIYLAPSQFEAGFVSTAHTIGQIDRTIAAADATLTALSASVHA